MPRPDALSETRLSRLNLRPGDTVVVMTDMLLSSERARGIVKQVEEFVPGHRVIVLDGGIKIGVLGKAGLKKIEKSVKPRYERR